MKKALSLTVRRRRVYLGSPNPRARSRTLPCSSRRTNKREHLALKKHRARTDRTRERKRSEEREGRCGAGSDVSSGSYSLSSLYAYGQNTRARFPSVSFSAKIERGTHSICVCTSNDGGGTQGCIYDAFIAANGKLKVI